MNRKRMLLLSILMCLLIFLTACGSQSNDGDVSPDVDLQTEDPEESVKPVAEKVLELSDTADGEIDGDILTVGNFSMQYLPGYYVIESNDNLALLNSEDGASVIVTVTPSDYSMELDEFIEIITSDIDDDYEVLGESTLDINGVTWQHKTISYKYPVAAQVHSVIITEMYDCFYAFSFSFPERKLDKISVERNMMVSSIHISEPDESLDDPIGVDISADEILMLSEQMYEADFERLAEFDIDQMEKLAVIMAARYFDIQQRADIDAIIELNPEMKDTIEEYRELFAEQLVTAEDYELIAVDSPELANGVFSFNAAYSFTEGVNNYNNGYMRYYYQWSDGRWIFIYSDYVNAEEMQKPNSFLKYSSMQEETERMFGTDNLLTLFDFGEPSYREALIEEFGW